MEDLAPFEEYRRFTRTLQPIDVSFEEFEVKFTQDRQVFRRMKNLLAEIMILQGSRTLSASRGQSQTEEEKDKCNRTAGVLQALHAELIADADRRSGIQKQLFQKLEELQQ